MKHLTNTGAIKKRRDSLRIKIRKDIEGLMALANPDGCLTFFEAAHAVLDSILISANTNPAPLSNYIADSYLEQTLKLGLSAQSNPKPANLKPKATGYLKVCAEPNWLSMCPPSVWPYPSSADPETVSMTDMYGHSVFKMAVGGSVATLTVRTLGVKAPPGYELVQNPAKDCYMLVEDPNADDKQVKISTKEGYVYAVTCVGAYLPATVVDAYHLFAEKGYGLIKVPNSNNYVVVKA